MDRILEYAQGLGAAATVAMALIWLLYLQLFFQDYRSRRIPRLIIQQADSSEPERPCTLINMSTMHIDILSILVTVRTEDGDRTRSLPEAEGRLKGDEGRADTNGPLAPGETLRLGSFRELVGEMDGFGAGEGRQARCLEIRVIFFHGMRDQPQGCCRDFDLEYTDGELRAVRPATVHTIHKTSWRQRRQVSKWYS